MDSDHSQQQVYQAIAKARQVQPAWAALSYDQRAKHVRAMQQYLVANLERAAEIIAQDVGKTRTEALATEVMAGVMAMDYYLKKGKTHLKSRRLRGGALLLFNKVSRLHRLPFGVVGIISPWNYPFGIPIHEIVPALLAGNGVIFKTARETAATGQFIDDLIRAGGLPDGLFSQVRLPGSQASDAMLAADHHVDKLFFTGSVPVGKSLMAKAANTLTPVSLELGGNDAMLVCEDAYLQRAVNGAIWAGIQNSGQSCGGVERIYVHRSVYQRFIDQLKQKVESLRQGEDSDHEVDLGSVCTQKQWQTIDDQVQEAIGKGATVYAQNQAPQDNERHFYPATVLINVDHTMRIMREETFGPVLAVMPVDDMNQALALANDSNLGLTGSVWSRNRKKACQLAGQIQAGAITINDHLFSHGAAETPWGGFKESGIGRSHGHFAFEEMTEPQVVIDDRLSFARRNVFWHPYGRSVYAGLKAAVMVCYGPWSQKIQHTPRFLQLLIRMFRG